MATHSTVLALRIPGTGEPGGLPSVGLHRVRHDWSDLASKQQRLQPHSFHAMAFPKTWDDHNRKKDTNLCCIWVKLLVATQVVCHTSVSRQPWFASGFPSLPLERICTQGGWNLIEPNMQGFCLNNWGTDTVSSVDWQQSWGGEDVLPHTLHRLQLLQH